MSDELTQIVILPPCADNGLAIAEDREIPFLRKFRFWKPLETRRVGSVAGCIQRRKNKRGAAVSWDLN
jgi:hypothetical protein